MNERRAKVICIVGSNGTGKSTLAVQLMQQQPRGLFLLPTFDDWAMRFPATPASRREDFTFIGINHYIMDRRKLETFAAIFNYFRDGVLVCDDPLLYTPKKLDEHPLLSILSRRRQMKCDIVFMAHGFMRIPPALFDHITDYIIFNTISNAERRKKELGQHYEPISKIIDKVNRRAKTDPHYCEIYKTGL